MKILFAIVLPFLAVSGCTKDPGHLSDTRAPQHPAGTNVGTSFPGVNQATSDTTATRSTDTTQ